MNGLCDVSVDERLQQRQRFSIRRFHLGNLVAELQLFAPLVDLKEPFCAGLQGEVFRGLLLADRRAIAGARETDGKHDKIPAKLPHVVLPDVRDRRSPNLAVILWRATPGYDNRRWNRRGSKSRRA